MKLWSNAKSQITETGGEQIMCNKQILTSSKPVTFLLKQAQCNYNRAKNKKGVHTYNIWIDLPA